MKVAIICEFSGTVRDSFTRLGHEATSFDLLPSETPGEHVQGDIQKFDRSYWSQFDLAICHPLVLIWRYRGQRGLNTNRRSKQKRWSLSDIS